MEDKSDETTAVSKQGSPLKKNVLKRAIIVLIIALISLVLLGGSVAGYVFASSPKVIREPKLEHYHFRMQILVNGKAENFSDNKYQQDYSKDQCNANLPEQPIHFHDMKDQFTHIHWEGMTGGMVMKYYGWNYIGGIDKALGYKLDNLKDVQKVNTHGNFLPTVPEDAKFFVFTGDERNYEEKSFDEWKNKDLEQFFNTTSNFPAHKINNGEQVNLLNTLFPKANAHGSEVHSTTTPTENSETESEDEKLTRINNLIGNVVIFVQKDKPNDQQIKARFSNLEPLSDSTCGG